MVDQDLDDEPFSERLRLARELKGLGAGELADRTGVPISSISHFEAGRRKPSLDSLRRLASALGVSSDYLLGLADDPRPMQIVSRNTKALSDSDRQLADDFIEMLRKRSRDR